jgi:CheY-like chemotaxis protein
MRISGSISNFKGLVKKKIALLFDKYGSNFAMSFPVECPKIFIVEDDRGIREAFETLLRGEGYGVESFADGQKAIDRLYQSPEPCLILLDMLMPVMNGEEFMEHFHRLPATILPIPVFLVSATSNLDASKKMGCKGFVKKPVNLEALLLIVKTFCKSNEKAA